MKKKIKCSKCEKEVKKLKELKKTKDGYFCKKCMKEKRKEHRKFLLRKIIGVRKRRSKEEIEEDRKRKEKEKREYKPIIKGAKERKTYAPRIGALGLYLTKEEKKVLYYKYIEKGLGQEEANDCIRNNVAFLNNLVEKMKRQNKTKEEINNKFKEEFAKICGIKE